MIPFYQAFDTTLQTPSLVLDSAILQNNIERMFRRTGDLGVALRPHFKTPKSLPIASRLLEAGAKGFTVSTLNEAEFLFRNGYTDIFYAVPADGSKAMRAAQLIKAGADLAMLVDSPVAMLQIARVAMQEEIVIPLWIEIDVDHYRTGIAPSSPDFRLLLEQMQSMTAVDLRGIMSYGGASYGCAPAAAATLAEIHRFALLAAADQVEALGMARPRLSFGSTPAVLHARTMQGIDEVRCGIFLFQDLFQAGIGACEIHDVALSVLTTVIGHKPELNRFTIDAGALALSKDRSTQGQSFDCGFGLICDAIAGKTVGDLYVTTVSQELGLVTSLSGATIDLDNFPIGTRLRVLPNHADMTAAAYEEYRVLDAQHSPSIWPRTNRW